MSKQQYEKYWHLLRFPVVVLRKGPLKVLRVIKVEKLRLLFESEKLLVRKQKASNCFPPKGFSSQLNVLGDHK